MLIIIPVTLQEQLVFGCYKPAAKSWNRSTVSSNECHVHNGACQILRPASCQACHSQKPQSICLGNQHNHCHRHCTKRNIAYSPTRSALFIAIINDDLLNQSLHGPFSQCHITVHAGSSLFKAFRMLPLALLFCASAAR